MVKNEQTEFKLKPGKNCIIHPIGQLEQKELDDLAGS